MLTIRKKLLIIGDREVGQSELSNALKDFNTLHVQINNNCVGVIFSFRVWKF